MPQCTGAPEPTPPPSSSAVTQPEPAAVAPVTAAELGATWRPGCPVAPAQLRRVTLTHLGFDARPHRGELIVHQELVPQVIAIFARLYRLDFPIEKMRPAAHYRGGDDELSMADNNTSAFNCRRVAGASTWSEHSYGRAIDINPVQNPYVKGASVDPPAGQDWTDRTSVTPGMIVDGDAVVRAFRDVGWKWGGHWHSAKDYQHFSVSGR